MAAKTKKIPKYMLAVVEKKKIYPTMAMSKMLKSSSMED